MFSPPPPPKDIFRKEITDTCLIEEEPQGDGDKGVQSKPTNFSKDEKPISVVEEVKPVENKTPGTFGEKKEDVQKLPEGTKDQPKIPTGGVAGKDQTENKGGQSKPKDSPNDKNPITTTEKEKPVENKTLSTSGEKKEDVQKLPEGTKDTGGAAGKAQVENKDGQSKPKDSSKDEKPAVGEEKSSEKEKDNTCPASRGLSEAGLVDGVCPNEPGAEQEYQTIYADKISSSTAAASSSVSSKSPSAAGSNAIAVLPVLQSQILSDIASRLASAQDAPQQTSSSSSGVASGDTVSLRRNLWGQITGGKASQNGSSDSKGYTFNTTGFTLGGDGLASENLRLGLAVSYLTANMKGKPADALKATSQHYFVSLYGAYALPSSWFVDGILSFGHHAYNSKRTGEDSKDIQGKFNGTSLLGKLSAGCHVKVSAETTLTPFVSFQSSLYKQKGYDEKVAQGNLHYKAASFSNPQVGIGAKINSQIKQENGWTFSPQVQAQYVRSLKGKGPTVAMVTTVPGYLDVVSTKMPKDLCEVGGALTLGDEKLSISLGYTASLGKKFVGHRGALKIGYKF